MTKVLAERIHLPSPLTLILLLACASPLLAQEGMICPSDAGFDDWIAENTIEYWSGDMIPLPDVDWRLTTFYPPAGTYLDVIDAVMSEDGEKHYSLETEFSFYGIPVDFDSQETEPPHFYLPLGWRDLEMITLEWDLPESPQVVREPDYRRGLVRVEDPSPFAEPGDELVVSPKIQVFGETDAIRDQVIQISWRFGCKALGTLDDAVYSIHDNGVGGLDSTVAWTPADSLMDADLADLAIGEQATIETLIDWIERHPLDPDNEEFVITDQDTLQYGTLTLYSTYERTGADEYALIETNMDCVHEIGRGLWLSFSPGALTADYTVQVTVETFEGYNVWRKIVGSSDQWVNIWSIGFNEEADKFYWWWVDGEYEEDAGINETAGTEDGYVIGSLTPIFGRSDELVFLDFDVHNGFVYEYAVTSFDRGYRPSSGGNDHYLVNSVSKEELDMYAERIVFNRPAEKTVVNSIYAVPNPLRTGLGASANPNYHNFPGNVVQFVGMTADTRLKVYTLAGDLVFEGENDDPLTANITWDTRNLSGELVESGVYIFRAEESNGDEEYGRLCIIR